MLAILDDRFHNEIFPILTPIAIDPGHPFPHLRNKSLNLGVMFSREGETEPGFGVVQVPMMLPRLLEVQGVCAPTAASDAARVRAPRGSRSRGTSATIFPGVKLKGVYTFRVTRNFDLEIDEEEAEDLLQTIQQELRRRERGNAVRLEVAGEPTPDSLAKLVRALKLDPERDVYRAPFLNVSDLMRLVPREERRDLRDEPFSPQVVPPLRDAEDIFARHPRARHPPPPPVRVVRSVVEFITRAAEDPDVLAIKQTLYRAGGDSPIVKALARAAEAGKQVTAIVELKARFDEESNIQWARTLEQSGVHVVYGLLGLKTHAKCSAHHPARATGKLRRYVHLSTGNYNPTTRAPLHRRRAAHGEAERSRRTRRRSSTCSRATARRRSGTRSSSRRSACTRRCSGSSRARRSTRAQGRPARIVAKMNSLVDEDVIEALYRASQAGVDDLAHRARHLLPAPAACPASATTSRCARSSIAILEHGRIFHFANGGKRRGLHLERRLDAAQLPPPRRDHGARSRTRRSARASSRSSRSSGRTTSKAWVLEPHGALRARGAEAGRAARSAASSDSSR